MDLTSVGHFTICTKCAVLAGQPQGRERYPQVCRCHWAGQERWPDHDFNEYLDLCWCCLLEAIPSGMKWGSFYCLECRDRVRSYNWAAGRVLIYLGRHSIQNGLGLRGGRDLAPEAVAAFAADLRDFGLGILEFFDAAAAWRPSRLRHVAQAAGLAIPEADGEISLAEYLRAAAGLADDPQAGKGAAFTGLVRHLGFPVLPGLDTVAPQQGRPVEAPSEAVAVRVRPAQAACQITGVPARRTGPSQK